MAAGTAISAQQAQVERRNPREGDDGDEDEEEEIGRMETSWAEGSVGAGR
jgi:hypothetical protein